MPVLNTFSPGLNISQYNSYSPGLKRPPLLDWKGLCVINCSSPGLKRPVCNKLLLPWTEKAPFPGLEWPAPPLDWTFRPFALSCQPEQWEEPLYAGIIAGLRPPFRSNPLNVTRASAEQLRCARAKVFFYGEDVRQNAHEIRPRHTHGIFINWLQFMSAFQGAPIKCLLTIHTQC